MDNKLNHNDFLKPILGVSYVVGDTLGDSYA